MAARFAALARQHHAKILLTACAHATPQCHTRWACTKCTASACQGSDCALLQLCDRHHTCAWLSRGALGPSLQLRLVAVLLKACKCCEG